MITSLESVPEDFILAIVVFIDAGNHRAHYLRKPVHEPDFSVARVNYDFAELLTRSMEPS